MKIVINSCFGGFRLSKKAKKLYAELSGMESKDAYDYDLERTDPILIQVVETLGEEANSRCSRLNIVDIPDDVEWEITDYDGLETVEEKHRKWS